MFMHGFGYTHKIELPQKYMCISITWRYSQVLNLGAEIHSRMVHIVIIISCYITYVNDCGCVMQFSWMEATTKMSTLHIFQQLYTIYYMQALCKVTLML